MLKRLILLATSAAALLALAAPTTQANGPLITNVFGEAPWKITPRSTDTTIQTSAGTLECQTVKFSINLTTNANTTVIGNGSGTAEGTPKATPVTHNFHCGSSSGVVVDITSATISKLHLTKHGAETTGTASLSFTYDLRSNGFLIAECTFGGTVPVTRTFESWLDFEGKVVRTAGTAFCPAEGTLDGDFFVLNEIEVSPVTIH